jgi:TolA-binding protein
MEKQMKISKSLVHTAALLATAMFMSGCLATRDDIREGVKSDPPSQEQQQLANNQANYQELETQTRQLLGRVETLENSVNILGADKTGAHQEQTAKNKMTEDKIKILEDAITKLENEQVQLSQKLESLKASQAASASADAAAKDSKASVASKKGAFDAADAEFLKKKWKDSIVLFQKYRDMSPTGKRFAEATYKIGSAFQELGMKPEAKSFFSDVAEKFPKSEWGKKATVHLKALK